MNDRVTWLIPIKNGMPYLPETLASIEAQTYKNWEVLVWDNGSTDGTVEELYNWIPNRLPGRVICGEPLTLGGSLARMIEVCETELCARIDADDINLPERLEKQVAFLSKYPAISVLGSWAYFIDEEGLATEDLFKVPLNHEDIVNEMLVRNTIAHPTVIFKRSHILQSGNYRDLYLQWNKVNIEDYDLWLRVAQQYKLANLDIPLLKYRIHENSTTQMAIRENRINKAMDDCICENAPGTFGCKESEMRLLRERKHPFAARLLLQIAKHLQYSQDEKSINRLHSSSFIDSAKRLISTEDIITGLWLSAYHPDQSSVYGEVKSISKSLLRQIPGLTQLKGKLSKYFYRKEYKRKFKYWIETHKDRGTIIHSSTTLTGNEKPFTAIDIGMGCILEPECTIWLSTDIGAEVRLSLGDRSYIGRNTYIGVFKPILIGKCVLIGAYCYIISANHNYKTRNIPIIDQGFIGTPIIIEDDVWIGTHVTILPGVSIGKGAIIAAHSLVNKDVPSYEVWGGVPAKFLKERPS